MAVGFAIRSLALACASASLGCGGPPPEAHRTPRALADGVTTVRELPWLGQRPELGGPGEIHVATDGSWELYEEAGGRRREGTPPYSVFAMTAHGATIAVEPALTGRVVGFHADQDGWRFALGSAERHGLSLVRVDGAGAVVATDTFEGPSVYGELTPIALASAPMLVRRLAEVPGGGGGLEVQLGPAYPADLVDVRWCEPECHLPLALLIGEEQLMVLLQVAGAAEAPIQLGVVMREGVREVRPLGAADASQACDNAVYTHDGATARARVPTDVDRSTEIAIEGARWLPGPNTHPSDLDVCVEEGALRARAAGGEWVLVSENVDPERVWASCNGRACVSVFAGADGTHRLARFAL